MEILVSQVGRFQSLIKLIDSTRFTNRLYSVYAPCYKKPIFRKEDQALLEETGEVEELAHVPFKPPTDAETCSEFYDPVVRKFTNYMLRMGKKGLARSVLEETFLKIKRTQLQHYYKASPETKTSIILNPTEILYKAIDNVTPVMELVGMKRGGTTYQVPVPLSESRQKFLAMNWLIKAAKEKPGPISYSTILAKELIEAAHNHGRVVKKKQELHKQCEANRAYAHYRWT